MRRSGCSAPIVATSTLALLLLAGCGTVELFGTYDLPESPGVAAAPWPDLVDVPEAPPVGVYTEAVPDPAQGALAQADLGAAAVAADIRATALAEPVIAGPERAALDRPRPAGLSGPVISEAERAELLARARRTR